MNRKISWTLALALSMGFLSNISPGQDAEAKGTTISLASSKLIMQAPKEWKKTNPRSSMIQYEFSAPADAKEEEPSVRITIMGAGGSIEANIERWYGQFSQPNGKSTKDASKSEKFEVDGQVVHFVDIPGTFKETMGGGPFSGGKTVEREDYRMLGAIVVTKEMGQYFIKATGPSAECEKLRDGFLKMLKEIEVK